METIKLHTQRGLILAHMVKNPYKWFLVGDFCGGKPSCPYVGYKASARISELQKAGHIRSRWSGFKTAMGGKLKEYRFNSVERAARVDSDTIEVIVKPDLPF